MPLVDDPFAIQVNPNAVVGAGLKAIAPVAKIDPASPAHREIVVRQIARRTIAPIEIDILVIAGKFAIIQVAVRIIFALPIGVVVIIIIVIIILIGYFLPPEREAGLATTFVIFDPQVVQAAAQADLSRNFAGRAIVPGLDDELVINPQASAVVHKNMETIGAAVKVLAAGPASREVIRRHIGCR